MGEIIFWCSGNTKCVNKHKLMAQLMVQKQLDSGIIKGYQNDKEASNQYYMNAIDGAKPMLMLLLWFIFWSTVVHNIICYKDNNKHKTM